MFRCVGYLLTGTGLLINNRKVKDNRMYEIDINDDNDNGWGFYVILDIEDIRPIYKYPLHKQHLNKYSLQQKLYTIQEEEEGQYEENKLQKIKLLVDNNVSIFEECKLYILCLLWLSVLHYLYCFMIYKRG